MQQIAICCIPRCPVVLCGLTNWENEMAASITDFYQTSAESIRAKYDAAHTAAYDAIGRRAAYDAYITDLAALCGTGVQQPSATPVATSSASPEHVYKTQMIHARTKYDADKRALTTLGEWCHSNPITTPVADKEHTNMTNSPPRMSKGNFALPKADLAVARAKYDAAKQIAYDAYIADLAALCNTDAPISDDVTNS